MALRSIWGESTLPNCRLVLVPVNIHCGKLEKVAFWPLSSSIFDDWAAFLAFRACYRDEATLLYLTIQASLPQSPTPLGFIREMPTYSPFAVEGNGPSRQARQPEPAIRVRNFRSASPPHTTTLARYRSRDLAGLQEVLVQQREDGERSAKKGDPGSGSWLGQQETVCSL